MCTLQTIYDNMILKYFLTGGQHGKDKNYSGCGHRQ